MKDSIVKTVCEINKCNGCYLCENICSQKAIDIIDNTFSINAYIDTKKCIKCNKCVNLCPNNNIPAKQDPLFIKQGWSKNNRNNSSSGGMAFEFMLNFVKNGGYVCTCKNIGNDFKYIITRDVNELKECIGSKYVKSNPSGIYKEVESLLKKDEKVLFIGLPCHSAALQNYINSNLKNNLYTVDLICHGTPSKKFLYKYLIQNKKFDNNKNVDLKFRDKNSYGLHYKNSNEKVERDDYIDLFLGCISFTENCYICKYASKKRCSDITIDDSWGTDLIDEADKGINLLLCQTNKGRELIEKSDLVLKEVNEEKAIKANSQLMHPAICNNLKRQFLKFFYRFHFRISFICKFIFVKRKIRRLIDKINSKFK